MDNIESEHILQLKYALAKQVPAMASGFSIHTNYGDIEIDGEDAQYIASAVSTVLERKLVKLKGRQQEDESCQK